MMVKLFGMLVYHHVTNNYGRHVTLTFEFRVKYLQEPWLYHNHQLYVGENNEF